MTTDEYVPSEDDVKTAWADRRLFLDSLSGGASSPDAVYDAEFDRFLTRVRCEAYDEGYQDAQDDEREHRPGRKSVHPYRETGGSDDRR